jgi:hypothetical protein
MSPEKYRALLKWMIGLFLSALVAGVVYAYLNRQTMGDTLGTAALLGWVVPLGVLFVIVAVSWFLLAQDRPEQAAESVYVICPVCGKAILRDWRMCPYCGERAGRAEPAEDNVTAELDVAASHGDGRAY